ncbi:hypothetical protein PIB30_107367 [Stylosanthes scabra]|uniref:Uncharacterized protein n=1 Tax=Stylosanthes scabra TaxID=79078 RepID=A0ABU6ZXM5_9FABA|nr:hypothetical protein [Stylosanthes scabra]
MGNAPRQPNFDPYSKTFNLGWRHHPNFGWGGQGNQGERCYNNNFQQLALQLPTSPIQPFVSQKLSQLEVALQKLTQSTSTFIDSTTNFMHETRANFKNQETSIRNMEVQIGQIPRQLSERPPNIFPSNTIPNSREECKAIRVIAMEEIPDVQVEALKEKQEVVAEKQEVIQHPPQSSKKHTKPFSKFLEVSSCLKVDIPLLK